MTYAVCPSRCRSGHAARGSLGAVALFLTVLVCAPATAHAQGQTPAAGSPPLPVAPSVVNRDATGHVSMRAVRVTTPIKIDGQLDEAIYQSTPSMSDFVQTEPTDGLPATEKTEIWVLYDKDFLYLVARCHETHPERMIANEMRRDSNPVYTQTDNIAFMLDPSYDRRNGYVFVINSVGGRNDGQFTDGKSSLDFNPIWKYKTGTFKGGWTVETAIPFKSIRYQAGAGQLWGLNAERFSRWKNEVSYLNRVPAGKGQGAIIQSNLAGPLVGIEAPPVSRNLEIKPYAIANIATNRLASPPTSNDLTADVGVDAKYGLTQNLSADLTYNTDFAQVEADEAQVNLTRFSLFFPEKREFFLENQGAFTFGGVVAPSLGNTVVIGDAPLLFYSRRVGLNGANIVPIHGGGRVSGRMGKFTLGLLNIESAKDTAARAEATNFTVVRVKRDFLRRSSLGMIYSGRSTSQSGIGRNDAYGVDGVFGFFANLSINTHWAKTDSPNRTGEDTSYRGQLDYAADRYAVQVERLRVGRNFNPEIGFTRRLDIDKTYGLFRFSPRPKSKRIRKYTYQGSATLIETASIGRTDTRSFDGSFGIDYQSGDKISVGATQTYEFIPAPFVISRGVVVPVAGYDYTNARFAYTFGQQRKYFGSVSLDAGSFYGGHKATLNINAARLGLTPRLYIEPTLSLNQVRLPQGDFLSRVVGSRVTFTVSPMMFISGLVQYNSATATFGSNVRLRWEYQPGSEMFVVYNDQLDTHVAGTPMLQNRSFVVKINKFFRF